MPAIGKNSSWLAWFQLERVFVILALVFGTSLVFATAPFQVPDEVSHFWRSYQVSQGQFIPERRADQNWPGGELPDSVVTLPSQFGAIATHPEVKCSAARLGDALKVPLHPKNQYFVGISQSVYAPSVYFPQAIGIRLARVLRAPPLVLMYVGRLFNLLAWTAIGYASLRILPVGRCAVMLLLLMPMSLFEAASLSADAMTNALAVFVTAMICRYSLAPRNPTGQPPSAPAAPVGVVPLVVLTVASVALTMGKMAYVPMAGLIFLIPESRLGGRRRWAIITSAFCTVNVVALAWWASRTPGLNLHLVPQADAWGQVAFLLHHPIELLRVPFHTLNLHGQEWITELVGTLGWLDTSLPHALIQSTLWALLIACVPAGDNARPASLRRWMTVTAPIIVGSIYLIMLLDYLCWTAVGAASAEGVQGRYFIPLAPALLLLVGGAMTRALPRGWAPRAVTQYRDLVLAAFAAVSCVTTVVVVYQRYFGA